MSFLGSDYGYLHWSLFWEPHEGGGKNRKENNIFILS